MDISDIKRDLNETLKKLPGFKGCVNPDVIEIASNIQPLCQIQFTNLLVTAILVGTNCYVIVYQTKEKTWPDIIFNIFDIEKEVYKVLKKLQIK